ncbi:hypothetical protein SCALM49S_06866 [Streptomyces californicus]
MSPVSPLRTLPGVRLNVSQIDGVRPPSAAPPSIWYAAVAVPHRNPVGKRSTVPVSGRAPVAVAGRESTAVMRRTLQSEGRRDDEERAWAWARAGRSGPGGRRERTSAGGGGDQRAEAGGRGLGQDAGPAGVRGGGQDAPPG